MTPIPVSTLYTTSKDLGKLTEVFANLTERDFQMTEDEKLLTEQGG